MDTFDSCLNSETSQRPESQIAGKEKPSFSVNQDDDDFMESSISLEKSHIEEGYTDGYKDGFVLGIQDGYEVGLKHGFECGEELGFYRGLVDVLISAIRIESNCFSARVQKNIQQMRELLDKYPFTDPEDERKDDMLEALRLKFRAICATLGVKLEYNGYPKKSDTQEIEF